MVLYRDLTETGFSEHPVLRRHPQLLSALQAHFAPDDELIMLKAPGRVNLIGEHTDYNMGPVLPCAIDREIVICLRPGGDCINAVNVDAKYPQVSFALHASITADAPGHWGNYIKAGVKGILDYRRKCGKSISKLSGFDAIVSGNIPAAAGLSSSSALVVASALAMVKCNDLDIDTATLAGICAQAEHFVGTAGGGMDQAASLLGQPNTFLKMDFNPLRTRPVPAPSEMRLVLLHSLVTAEKSAQARQEYNRRVLECRMAMDLFNRQSTGTPKLDYIGQIIPEYTGHTVEDLDELVRNFLTTLPREITLTSYLHQSGWDEKDWLDHNRDCLDGQIDLSVASFKLYSRFKHVYSECRRVSKAVQALQAGKLKVLGKLLNESHTSLAADYEVSVPQVDELVKNAITCGALGARIMGAGFGGVVLALTTAEKMNELVAGVQNSYYKYRELGEVVNTIIPCSIAAGAGEIFDRPNS